MRLNNWSFFFWIIKILFLFIVMIVTLYPIFALLLTSFKLPRDFYGEQIFPTVLTLSNYREALIGEINAVFNFKNSFIIASCNTLLTLILSIPAAYGLVRYKGKINSDLLSLWFLLQRMILPAALLIPLFILFRRLHLIDNYASVIISYLIFNIPFAIWLLLGFFKDFPMEILDQTMIDGCSEVKGLIYVVLPLIMPGIVVTALFSFVLAWNDLLLALAFTRSNTQTLMVLFTTLIQSTNRVTYGPAAACAVIGIMPALILGIFLQRYLVHGLTLGALKQ